LRRRGRWPHAFQPPTFWATVGDSRRLGVRSEAELAGTGHRSRMTVRILLVPHGLLQAVTPVLRTIIRRHWDGNLRTIKTLLETRS
jgi:hypothetical protein